jgi:hypothetical protein
MLSWIVGAVDSNAAWVLVVLFLSLGAVATALVVKTQNSVYMSNQFVVEKLKEADAHALSLAQNARSEKVELAQIASKQEVELARINGAQIEGARLVGSSGSDV